MRIGAAVVAVSMTFAVGFAAAQNAPAPGSAHVTFTFDHPQLQPSHYSISVDETGAGQYASKPGPASDPTDGVFPTPLDRPVLLDDALRGDLFRYARAHNFFATNCSTARTSMAFTGNKTLAYTGPDGSGSCIFVWSDDPVLERLVDQLGAVAFTLEEGRRLELEARHDRLGLDAELASLQDAYKDKRALDLGNIADQLHAIAENDEVMDRVRKRAEALLAQCDSRPKAN